MADPCKTVASVADLRAAICAGYEALVGHAPSPNLLGMITAQACLETGSGASMYNWNFGGIKGSGTDGTVSLRTHEVIGGVDTVMRQNFRAYKTLADGATDFVRLIVTHYQNALPAAEAGDCTAYATALKARGYFTASAASYAAGLAVHFKPIALAAMGGGALLLGALVLFLVYQKVRS
jgi:flagellar protein FlgJ